MTASPYKNNVYLGISFAVITTIIWSGNYVIARDIAKQLPPVSLAFYRWGLASVCIIPLALKSFLKDRHIILQNKQYIFWVSLTGVGIFNTFIYMAGHYTSAINMALIGTTSAPIFTILLSAIFLKEHFSKWTIIGKVICVAGILFLLSQGSIYKLMRLHFGLGDVFILISSFAFSIYSILVRKKHASISGMSFLMVTFITGTLLLLPFYIYENITHPAVEWHGTMIAKITYLGLGNSIIGFMCWNAAIKKMGAAKTVIFTNLIPVFSTVEAVIFLNEAFTTIHLISGIIVIAGLIIANIHQSKTT
jgi:drug/metabolite transporter (DMT)-like permease